MILNHIGSWWLVVVWIATGIWSVWVVSLILVVCCCACCPLGLPPWQLPRWWKVATLVIVTMRLEILAVLTESTSKTCGLTGSSVRIDWLLIEHLHLLGILHIVGGGLGLSCECSVRILMILGAGILVVERIISSWASLALLEELPICTIWCSLRSTNTTRSWTALAGLILLGTLCGARSSNSVHRVVIVSFSLAILLSWC